MERIISSALGARWAGVDDEAGGQVADLPTALVAVTNPKGIAGQGCSGVIVRAHGTARALSIVGAR